MCIGILSPAFFQAYGLMKALDPIALLHFKSDATVFASCLFKIVDQGGFFFSPSDAWL